MYLQSELPHLKLISNNQDLCDHRNESYHDKAWKFQNKIAFQKGENEKEYNNSWRPAVHDVPYEIAGAHGDRCM